MARAVHGVKLVPVMAEHVAYVASHARDEERLEMEASWNETVAAALRRSLACSREAFTALGPHGLPLCIGGITEKQVEGWWNPWLIGSTDVLLYRVAFLRASLWYADSFWVKYRKLKAWIDARYEASLRWAAWLGCDVDAPRPWGANGALFCEVRLDWEARS